MKHFISAMLFSATLCGCSNPPVLPRLSPLIAEISPTFTTVGNDVLPQSKSHLYAAINETIGFPLSIVTPNDIASPRITATAPTSTKGQIPMAAVEIFRIQPVNAARIPGWHVRAIPPSQRLENPLDVLVPIRAPTGGNPTRIAARRPEHLWIDLTIPKGTPDGLYSGEIQIHSGKKLVTSFGYQVTVLPFVLPDESSIPLIAELDHASLLHHHSTAALGAGRDAKIIADPAAPERRTTLNHAMQMLRRHGLTPVLSHLTPEISIDEKGDVSVDWTAYDELVSGYISGDAFPEKRPSKYWPAPIAAFLRKNQHASAWKPTDRVAMQFARQCTEHFAQHDWLERTYLLLPADPAQNLSDCATVREWSIALRNSDFRLKLATHCFAQNMLAYGWSGFQATDVTGYADIWAPRAQFFDAPTLTQESSQGSTAWLSADRPPFSGSNAIHVPQSAIEILSWQASALHAQALYIGPVNRWPDSIRDPAPGDCIAHDPRVLIYPGKPFGLTEPVPSVRLKHLRRSMQDAAYLDLLEQHGLSHIAETIRTSLVAYAGIAACKTHFADGRSWGWPADPRAFERARHIMSEELLAATTRGDGEEHADFARSTNWRRFLLDSRRLEVEFEGAALRVADAKQMPDFELQTEFVLTNRRRTPLEIEPRLSNLPEGWSGQGDSTAEPRTMNLNVGESRRYTNTIRTTLPAMLWGKTYLPFVVSVDPQDRIETTAVIAAVTAPIYPHAIQIDGDLSDWPAGSINVLADFDLIARSNETAAPVEKPRHRTTAFVLRDETHLFVAVNCEQGPEFDRLPTSRKGVRYDDLIPQDEELIEILIDPLNARTRSPSDLFHIVVKRTGSDLVEKGIETNPPSAAVTPWSARIEIANRTFSDRWTTEIRIPLAALNLHIPPSGTVAGFNVTRFNAARQEFSTWSGATSNAYDPLSLGNLYIPQR